MVGHPPPGTSIDLKAKTKVTFNWTSDTRVLVCIIAALFVHHLGCFVATVSLNDLVELGLKAKPKD
jgi:hypothetical protein